VKTALRPAAWALILWWLLEGCSSGTLLENHEPWSVMFRKQTRGGAAALVGTELSAPSFSLYANGFVIYYQYREGRRVLVRNRLSARSFFQLFGELSRVDTLACCDGPSCEGASCIADSLLPITLFQTINRSLEVRGLGICRGAAWLDTLQALNLFVDRLSFVGSRPFVADSIRLFVKKPVHGSTGKWPKWAVKEVELSAVYTEYVSPYEPNIEANSTVLAGHAARAVQRLFTQHGIYQSFSSGGEVYQVGFRALVP
jgi:hypothetical protein